MNLIWSSLLKENDPVSEIAPNDFLGHNMIFSENESMINFSLFNQKSA